MLFLVCALPSGGGGGGGMSEFLDGWVSNRPPPPPPVGHCGGLWVSTEGAGHGILPVVRHFACGSWCGWVVVQ